MTESTDVEPSILHYFVDEAGDPTLFDRKGQILVGEAGCSQYFMLGKLEVADPEKLSHDLNMLRSELLADPYFKKVPSMQPANRKTALAFHAKDDLAEVRRDVYRLLREHDLRFYAVVRNKADLVAYVQQQNERVPSYRYSQNEQYDLLVKHLFRKLHHMAREVKICFAKRGTKSRSSAFRQALVEADDEFQRSFGFPHPGKNDVVSSTPTKSAGLQAVDYFLWALQRFYERREDRFIEMMWGQVGEIHDLDRIENGRRGVFYTTNKPLNLAAFEQ